ncbi:MAG: ABC transporter substrate-binding protein [Chloroflexi bacterium]|nr:ABC transporter substrate-binding protein [Chloroflexota bacterium]
MSSQNDDFAKKIKSINISRRDFLKFAGGALGAVAASQLAGCTPKATEVPVAETVAADAATAVPSVAEPTGSITFLSAENLVGQWDPYNNTSLAHDRLQQFVYDNLVYRDEDLKLVPGLAESWDLVDDTTLEFKLRKGVKFHDGQDFTAKDVKASIEHASNPDTVASFYYARPLEVEVVDDYTARIHTGDPYAALVSAALCAGQGAPIACAEDLEKGDEWMQKKFNGTGAFKWNRYGGEAEGVVLDPNMDYWGGPYNTKPKIKQFTFRYVGDAAARMAALQTGEAQMIDRVEPDEVSLIESDPNLKVWRSINMEAKWLSMRLNMAPMDNKLLRQAIFYAIDRETIVNDILFGSGKVTDSYLTSSQDFYAPDPNFPSYNPDKAKQLLSDAGYPNGEGLEELTVMFSVGFYPKNKEIGEFFIQNLTDIGIKAKLTLMEVAAYNQNLFIHDSFHIVDHGWFLAAPDPDGIFNSLFLQGLTTGADVKEVNDAILKQGATMDPEARGKVIRDELVPALIDNVIEIPYLQSEMITGYSGKLQGLNIGPTSYWFLEKISI